MFATVPLGDGLCGPVEISRFQGLIERRVFGVGSPFLAVKGYGKYLAEATSCVSRSKVG